ncbi:histidine phosphatase family protein [Deinococcus psychrotolerans]|uniref:Histidine phosphatase family protein n=1 Tax=Deinococcus psychrotolerans TaxID=2489213 RepID=A0A3G8YD69_9DEIO|nr:histidine phosphatase family protein [Deinococcus psychrotolerans]AZI42925.1 histidine phosphatase family protein [Deinococcus psychrotolerans]
MSTLLLARHGRTAHNSAGKIQGRSQVPLDETGQAQAGQLASHIAALESRPSQIWASDLLRAEQTAGEVAARLGLPITTDVRLREQEFGEHEGHLLSELLAENPRFAEAWTQDFSLLHPPGGESFAQTTARMLDWFETARPRKAGEVVLAVSHGLALTGLLCALSGLTPREAMRQELFRHANAAYTVLTLDTESGEVLACSAVQSAHLIPLTTS